MDKRYQVFVSSTYEDLREERQEVIQALLELDCIPAGMELFPAADEDQWTLIRNVIDDCDYYIVIIAGRYGSCHPSGKSYTQMEYEYAVEQGKPVIAFLHQQPDQIISARTEQSKEGKICLEVFRELAKKKTCKYWTSSKDLGGVVSRSIINQIKKKPGVGWVRADLIPSEASALEMLRLKREIEELKLELSKAASQPPEGAQALAQGEDETWLIFDIHLNAPGAFIAKGKPATGYYEVRVKLTWNQIFARVGPQLLRWASEGSIRTGLTSLFKQEVIGLLFSEFESKEVDMSNLRVSDLRKAIIQLRALGLISMNDVVSNAKKDSEVYWSLTGYGDTALSRLVAIPSDTIHEQKSLPIEIQWTRLSQSPF